MLSLAGAEITEEENGSSVQWAHVCRDWKAKALWWSLHSAELSGELLGGSAEFAGFPTVNF